MGGILPFFPLLLSLSFSPHRREVSCGIAVGRGRRAGREKGGTRRGFGLDCCIVYRYFRCESQRQKRFRGNPCLLFGRMAEIFDHALVTLFTSLHRLN